jgi:hypothetical protein
MLLKSGRFSVDPSTRSLHTNRRFTKIRPGSALEYLNPHFQLYSSQVGQLLALSSVPLGFAYRKPFSVGIRYRNRFVRGSVDSNVLHDRAACLCTCIQPLKFLRRAGLSTPKPSLLGCSVGGCRMKSFFRSGRWFCRISERNRKSR